MTFLGHILCNGTVSPWMEKSMAIRACPEPTDVKGIQAFQGLAGYFRKFVPQFAILARPMTELTKADVAFEFGPKQRQAFEMLKDALCGEPNRTVKPSSIRTRKTNDSEYNFTVKQSSEPVRSLDSIVEGLADRKT